MMKPTISEQRRFAAALNERGLWEKRHDVCAECLKRPVSSIAESNSDELRKVTNDLSSDERWGWADFKNPQHRRVLSVCYQLGWTRFHRQLGRTVADPERLGRWLKYYSAPKKPLKQCTQEEVGQIIKAMECMLVNRMK